MTTSLLTIETIPIFKNYTFISKAMKFLLIVINPANQLTGFYMRTTLALNGLM